MEIKKIKIGIKTEKEALNEFAQAYKQATKGEAIEKKKGVFFESIEAVRKFMTPKRIELIRVIHHTKPASAYGLAKAVQRDVKSVMHDLRILKTVGLVTLKKEETNREKIRPLVEYDSVQVEIAV